MPVPLIQSKKLPDATGVAANSQATMVVPSIGTFYESRFEFLTAADAAVSVANIKSSVTAIKTRVDGDLILDATPTFLFDRQKYYTDKIGADNIAGVLPVDYAKTNITLPGERAQLALGTRGVDQIVHEFTLGTLAGSLAKISHTADVTVEDRPPGPHLRINQFPQTFGTTGVQEVVTLPKEPGTGYTNIHIYSTAGTVVDVTLIVDGNEILDAVKLFTQQSRLERYGRNPQANYYHIDFGLMDELLGFLPMNRNDGRVVQDLRLKINWSVSPSNYTIFTERVYNLNAPVK